MARATADFALDSRQPLGFRVIPENVEESVRVGVEVPCTVDVLVVQHCTLPSGDRTKKQTWQYISKWSFLKKSWCLFMPKIYRYLFEYSILIPDFTLLIYSAIGNLTQKIPVTRNPS